MNKPIDAHFELHGAKAVCIHCKKEVVNQGLSKTFHHLTCTKINKSLNL